MVAFGGMGRTDNSHKLNRLHEEDLRTILKSSVTLRSGHVWFKGGAFYCNMSPYKPVEKLVWIERNSWDLRALGKKIKSRNCSCWMFSFFHWSERISTWNQNGHCIIVIPEAAAIILLDILGKVHTEKAALCWDAWKIIWVVPCNKHLFIKVLQLWPSPSSCTRSIKKAEWL